MRIQISDNLTYNINTIDMLTLLTNVEELLFPVKYRVFKKTQGNVLPMEHIDLLYEKLLTH